MRIVAFDKTGTLTVGQPRLVHVDAFDGEEVQLLRLAAAVQSGSEHPLAKAVLGAAAERGLRVEPASGVRALSGLGVRGQADGVDVFIGNERLMQTEDIDVTDARAAALAQAAQGRTVSWVATRDASGARVHGLFAFGDSVRPESREAIAALHALGLRTVLISGDNAGAANAVARASAIRS